MISKLEAAQALCDVERVQHRTIAAGTYRQASPQLILSGAIWTVGYVATGLTRPSQWSSIWVPLMVVGMLGSFVMALRSRRLEPGNPAAGVRYASRGLWLTAAIMVFVVLAFLLFQPVDTLAYLLFPALVMALLYVIVGSFGMLRLIWIGGRIFAVTIFGLLFGREAIAFWIAAAGGGGLLLGGVWMRKT